MKYIRILKICLIKTFVHSEIISMYNLGNTALDRQSKYIYICIKYFRTLDFAIIFLTKNSEGLFVIRKNVCKSYQRRGKKVVKWQNQQLS